MIKFDLSEAELYLPACIRNIDYIGYNPGDTVSLRIKVSCPMLDDDETFIISAGLSSNVFSDTPIHIAEMLTELVANECSLKLSSCQSYSDSP